MTLRCDRCDKEGADRASLAYDDQEYWFCSLKCLMAWVGENLSAEVRR